MSSPSFCTKASDQCDCAPREFLFSRCESSVESLDRSTRTTGIDEVSLPPVDRLLFKGYEDISSCLRSKDCDVTQFLTAADDSLRFPDDERRSGLPISSTLPGESLLNNSTAGCSRNSCYDRGFGDYQPRQAVQESTPTLSHTHTRGNTHLSKNSCCPTARWIDCTTLCEFASNNSTPLLGPLRAERLNRMNTIRCATSFPNGDENEVSGGSEISHETSYAMRSRLEEAVESRLSTEERNSRRSAAEYALQQLLMAHC